MKVKEVMERVGSNETGKIVAYLKDGLEEINMLTETHTKVLTLQLVENKRFYDIPNDAVKMIDVTIKNHLNSRDEHRSIPRMLREPLVKDSDNT